MQKRLEEARQLEARIKAKEEERAKAIEAAQRKKRVKGTLKLLHFFRDYKVLKLNSKQCCRKDLGATVGI